MDTSYQTVLSPPSMDIKDGDGPTYNSSTSSDPSLLVSMTQVLTTLTFLSPLWNESRVLLGVVFGMLLELWRRSIDTVINKLSDWFWVTATFEADTSAWLLHWLHKEKVFENARNLHFSAALGLDVSRTDHLGDLGDVHGLGNYHVSILPSPTRSYSFWYKGCYSTVQRMGRNQDHTLTISMLTLNSKLTHELLVEARAAYKLASEHCVIIYTQDEYVHGGSWQQMAVVDKRPLSSLILEAGVMEFVLDDIHEFLNNKQWYAKRGIPYRRGYLLSGAPGCGKTSMIRCIAGKLGLHIFVLSLTGLTDQRLLSLTSRLPNRCIVLMEDIDAIFPNKRDIPDPERLQPSDWMNAPMATPYYPMASMPISNVTLSGLLNALDGIAAHEGRILFASTNNYSGLDPALLRPGRLDIHIKFDLASADQAKRLFKHFYEETEDSSSDNSSDRGLEEKNYSTSIEKSLPLATHTEPDKVADNGTLNDQDLSVVPKGVDISGGSTGCLSEKRRLPLELSPEEAEALGSQFSATIPSHTFSMATLQGYLLSYMSKPHAAIADAPAWVEKILKEKEETAKEEKEMEEKAKEEKARQEKAKEEIRGLVQQLNQKEEHLNQ